MRHGASRVYIKAQCPCSRQAICLQSYVHPTRSVRVTDRVVEGAYTGNQIRYLQHLPASLLALTTLHIHGLVSGARWRHKPSLRQNVSHTCAGDMRPHTSLSNLFQQLVSFAGQDVDGLHKQFLRRQRACSQHSLTVKYVCLLLIRHLCGDVARSYLSLPVRANLVSQARMSSGVT